MRLIVQRIRNPLPVKAAINSQQQALASQQAIQQPYVAAGQTALQQLQQGTSRADSLPSNLQ